MPEQRMNRRKFFRRVGVGLGIVAAWEIGRRLLKKSTPKAPPKKGELFSTEWEIKPYLKEYYELLGPKYRANFEIEKEQKP